MHAIAIVGMGCRFAGAPDLQSFWEMTRNGRNAFGPPPPDRWDHEAFFSTSKRHTDKSYAPVGGFIDDIRSFPALTLGIPPRRVEVMDPQQRFALEVGMQAIEDAGYTPSELPKRTGVFMGVTASEFRQLLSSRIIAAMMANGQLGDAPDPEAVAAAVSRVVPPRPFTAPGVLANMVAAAVAQELDLHGPAYTLDAACASAHIALSDAVLQLRAGSIDAAIAGGVYVCITPEHHVAFSRIGAMSPSGHCRPFDARADGFVQGDGAGAVLLKRLDDALRDGDRVYAVIQGVSINNDGHGDGPMAPVEDGQVRVIRDAWQDSGVDPARLGYVETHGTGTDVGDVTEFRGLMRSIGEGVRRAWLGSSKANVGHTMSAAGIAGVLRAALAIHHGEIPPMGGFEGAKPELGLDGSPFGIPTEPVPWDTDDRVAGISSFGFGGTNGHVVLTSPTRPAPAPSQEPPAQLELVRISAPDEAKLRDLATRTAAALEVERGATVAGVARAWSKRRELSARLAIAARTVPELVAALREFGNGGMPRGAAFGVAPAEAPRIAFLYPGQGAQRTGMLRDLRKRFPDVDGTLSEMEEALEDLLPRPLTHLLYPELRDAPVAPEAAEEELTHTAHCQPALFACGVALTRLLDRVGVRPAVVAGHSLGEFNAAVTAGVLDARSAARFTAQRGRAMAAVDGDPGTMAAIQASREEVESLLVDGAVIANANHPRQFVVSGTTEAVRKVLVRAEEAGISAKPLAVSHGFHSPVFAELDVEPLVAGLELHDPQIPVASGIAAAPYASAGDAREVFRRHAASPVDFVGAVRQCLDAGATLFLQVGAGGPLASFARKIARDVRVLTLASLDDADGGRSLLETLGQLWTEGVRIDLDGITARAAVTSVPPAVLPREPYWPLKDTGARAPEFAGPSARAAAPRTAEAPTEPLEPARAEETATSQDPVFDRVVEVLAKVSSYPRDAVRPGLKLVDDLGFDSLMVTDMATGLADAFPGLGGLPQELLINGPTVQDIVDYVRGARGGAAAADDDAPLVPMQPVWRITPLPDRSNRIPGRVVVAGPGATEPLASGLGGALGDPLQADVLVWVDDFSDPVPVSAVLAGEAEWTDRAGDFVAQLDALAKADRTPDLLLVTRDDDPWAEALRGALRAVAREWPQALVKSVRCVGTALDAIDPRALIGEMTSSDRTVDVRLGAHREVLGFEPASSVEDAAVGPDDVVLVTGGTRGIGLAVARRLAERGARVVVVGRRPVELDGIVSVCADVTDREALARAVAPHGPFSVVVHAAGLLADGALGSVDPEAGQRARAVKVAGWLNALVAAGDRLRVAVGIGSWAGRMGNRHQAHYAAGNALLSALAECPPKGVRTVVGEFGPWISSEMASTIPAPVQASMRAEGVDFVGDAAGLDALLGDLDGGRGVRTHGRTLPWTTRARRLVHELSVETHPYLLDHAIEGVPILPLAEAADLLAEVACLDAPFEVSDLRLFTGVTVNEPVRLVASIRGNRAELRLGEREILAYRAVVEPSTDPPTPWAPLEGGEPSALDVPTFYRDVTFHGPLLQGLVSIDGVGEGFVRGRVRTGRPERWGRDGFTLDPLMLDSAFQLAATVAFTRFGRAGTPVAMERYVQLARVEPDQELVVEATFAADDSSDRFSAEFVIRGTDGAPVAVVEGAVAELRRLEGADEPLEIKREWIDPSTWKEVQDLELRLEMATAAGIDNPYFTVHEGTARDVTVVGGRELVNFSSYNYVGLSGDPRVLTDVKQAVERYGTSVSASRVASGERPFHAELEAELAAAQGAEDALVFTAGHATNVTTIGHLFGKRDLVLHDELIHDSILQGIKLSGAGRRGFRHDDPAHLEQLLREMRRHHEKVLIVIEGVYSMDGDICDLPAYIELKKKYGCMLMVDEAHSFGIVGATGRGVAEHHGIDGREVDLWMGTLSKSLASCGGWIAASRRLITYLRYTAPGFVYSAGLTPANGVAALSSLRLMLEEPWRVQKLQANARLFHDALVARGIDTGPARGASGVVPAITGNSLHALLLSQRLLQDGINVQPIVYPAVADDAARLRFFLSSTHEEEQLVMTADKVAKHLEAIRKEYPVDL